MDSPNITKPRTGTSSPSYQEDPPSEEVMNRILALRTEKERLKAELADSHIKIKKLASEILSLRELNIWYVTKDAHARENQKTSQRERFEDEDVSPKNTKHEVVDVGKASGL